MLLNEETKKITIKKSTPTPVDPYEYVDLGLPSGLLWATCNVGAESPEEPGLYFQWGDTVGYTGITADKKFKWSECPYQTVDTLYSSETKFTKYLGSVDSRYKDHSATDADANKTVLDLADDAAHVHMGGNWRMPTETDFNKLIGNTNYEWIEDYKGTGINGGLFTSQVNENTLFFLSAEHWTSNRRTVWDPLQVIRSVIDSAPWLYGDDDDRADGKCVRGVLDA